MPNAKKILAVSIGGHGIDVPFDENTFPGIRGKNGTDGGSATVIVGDNSDAFGYSGNGGNGQQGARGRSPQSSNPRPKPDGVKIVTWSVVKVARVLTKTEKESEDSIPSGDGGDGGNGGTVTIRMHAECFAEAVGGQGGNGGKPGLSLPESGVGIEGKAGNGGTIDLDGGPESIMSMKSSAGQKGKIGMAGNSGKWLIRIT